MKGGEKLLWGVELMPRSMGTCHVFLCKLETREIPY